MVGRAILSARTEDDMAQIEVIDRKKVSSEVAARLLDLLADGAFAPGDRLPSERDLAGRFGVSRQALREALQSLELHGLLKIVHGSGTFVISQQPTAAISPAASAYLTDHSVTEMLEARRVIESATARLAAVRSTDQDVASIQAALDRLLEQPLTAAEFAEADVEFHLAIASASGNPVLRMALQSVRQTHYDFAKHILEIPERFRRANSDHEAIFEAIRRGDGGAATTAMVRHLDFAELDTAALRRPHD